MHVWKMGNTGIAKRVLRVVVPRQGKNMYEREDTTYNDLRKNSFYNWLDELEQNEDIFVRGGVKLAKEYVAHLEGEITKLKESNELKKEYLKKLVSCHDK